jgi:hypothetical protein
MNAVKNAPPGKKVLTHGRVVEIIATTRAKGNQTADERIVEKVVSEIVDEGKRPTPEAAQELFRHVTIAPENPPILQQHQVPRPRK